jgi:transposase-like protein
VAESGRPITHVAGDLGVGSESLRKRVRQAEADAGKQPAVLKTSEREELAKLRAEVKDCAARRRARRTAHLDGFPERVRVVRSRHAWAG